MEQFNNKISILSSKLHDVVIKMSEQSKLEEMTAPEVVPNAILLPNNLEVKTEKKVEQIKDADKIFDELAKTKGYVKKKPFAISRNLKRAIATYIAVNSVAFAAFISSGVGSISAAIWYISPFSWMTLLVSLITTLPILINAWKDNGENGEIKRDTA